MFWKMGGSGPDRAPLPVVVPKERQGSDPDDSHHHRRRLAALVDRLPGWFRGRIHWLLRPESRWARIPTGILLILGSFLAVLPVFGVWMMPLGLILIAEDVPAVRRGVSRALAWMEKRWPGLFQSPG